MCCTNYYYIYFTIIVCLINIIFTITQTNVNINVFSSVIKTFAITDLLTKQNIIIVSNSTFKLGFNINYYNLKISVPSFT